MKRKLWAFACSPQGDQAASAGDDLNIHLWDVATGECRHVLNNDDVYFVMFSPNGKQLASASDFTACLWDVERGVRLHILEYNDIRSVVYSPQGDVIASASDDGGVRLWDTETGVCRQTLTGHSNYVVFSPKGDQVASISADMTVRLWDVGDGTSRPISSGHRWTVNQVKSSPKGTISQPAVTMEQCGFGMWQQEFAVNLTRSQFEGYSVAYSPQGDRIVSSSGDNTVRLWNAETGACAMPQASLSEYKLGSPRNKRPTSCSH